MLAISPRRATRLEETDLPEQRTRDGELDRDNGLEVLNGHVHGGSVLTTRMSGDFGKSSSMPPPKLESPPCPLSHQSSF
jgi:hypothetical protein